MKIAIYKPYKTIHWNDMAKDTNVWSREIKNFVLMMRDNGHECHILSKTDYQNDQEENIFKTEDLTPIKNFVFDALVVFNGAWSKDNLNEDDFIQMIPHAKTVLIASDLDLVNEEHNTDLYDVILTSSIQKIWGENTQYGAVQDYHMYGEELYKGGWEIRKHEGIFIGHDRHKEEKFMEYVMRPNMNFYGKCFALDINKIIPRDEAYSLLRKFTYSIVFFDKRVTDLGFVTARPLELMLHGVIPFIDSEYDADGLQFSKNSPLRVKNYLQLYNYYQNMDKTSFQMLQQTSFHIINSIVKGEEAYKLFMKHIQ